MMDKPFYTVAEAASILDVSRSTVILYITSGKLAATQLVDRGKYRIDAEELARFQKGKQ